MSWKKAQENLIRWRRDPVIFVREVFGVEPDKWQKRALRNYGANRRSGAKACKGPGKTAVLAWIAWHFLVCFPHPKVAATSISGENLRDGLWAEMSKWQHKSEMLKAMYVWTVTRIYHKDYPETWFMSARKWSKSADPEQQANTLAGLHADYIMFLIDEAGGVPDAVMAAAEAALANAGTEVNPDAVAKIIIMGNPTHLSGPLYRACTKEKSLWAMIEITGDPDDEERSPRISKQWAQEQIDKYGRDNAWVMVNVFGRFPPSSMNSLVGPDDMEAAMKRIVGLEAYSHAPKILGIDVAREGDDRTVIFPRQGLVAFKPRILRIPDSVQIAGQVAQAIQKWNPDAVNVDNTGGYGSGVIDTLRSWGYAVNDVHFSSKADNYMYFNKRAEMNLETARWIKKEGGCLPRIDELTEEACAVTYFHNKDKLQIVEKDQIKAEIGRSPDLWDALGLTFAIPVVAKQHPLGAAFQRQNNATDYEPVPGVVTMQKNSGLDDYNPIG